MTTATPQPRTLYAHRGTQPQIAHILYVDSAETVGAGCVAVTDVAGIRAAMASLGCTHAMLQFSWLPRRAVGPERLAGAEGDKLLARCWKAPQPRRRAAPESCLCTRPTVGEADADDLETY